MKTVLSEAEKDAIIEKKIDRLFKRVSRIKRIRRKKKVKKWLKGLLTKKK